MIDGQKYSFSWELIGDISMGRPYLGNSMRLEVYRLMQFTIRDILEKNYGTDEANRIFYEAGELAGKEFHEHFLKDLKDFDSFIKGLQNIMQELRIGIVRVEKSDLKKGQFVITVSEDLDCSGLPELDYEICKYDEGFIAGLLQSFSGKSFEVKEVDCWCTGDRTCRFKAEAVG